MNLCVRENAEANMVELSLSADSEVPHENSDAESNVSSPLMFRVSSMCYGTNKWESVVSA